MAMCCLAIHCGYCLGVGHINIYCALITSSVSLAEAKFKCHSKIDMVFLLDSSGSITRQQFEIAKKFSADLVKHFDISKEKTNVAVATYSQYAHTTRTFENHASQELALKAIWGLSYEGAASRLDLGLDLVKSTLFDTQKGARPTNKGRYLAFERVP